MSDQTDVEYFIKGKREMLRHIADLIYYEDYMIKSKKVEEYKLKLMEDLNALSETIKERKIK